MIRLVQAELLKLRTTRLLLWLGLLIFALTAFVVSTRIASTSVFDLAPVSEQRNIVQFSAVGALIALILGIVAVAGEYAHGTIDHTFLGTPVRERVVAAKLIAAAITGAAVTLFAEVMSYVVAAIWISAKAVPFELTDSTIWRTLAAILLAAALSAGLGVGLGALLRRQTAGIVLALIWLLVGEPVLSIAGVQKYAPGHAIAAIVVAGTGGSDLLDFWPGLLLTLAYVSAFVAVGTFVVSRADVT